MLQFPGFRVFVSAICQVNNKINTNYRDRFGGETFHTHHLCPSPARLAVRFSHLTSISPTRSFFPVGSLMSAAQEIVFGDSVQSLADFIRLIFGIRISPTEKQRRQKISLAQSSNTRISTSLRKQGQDKAAALPGVVSPKDTNAHILRKPSIMSGHPSWLLRQPSATAPTGQGQGRPSPPARNSPRPPPRSQSYSFQHDESVASTSYPQPVRRQRDTRAPRPFPGLPMLVQERAAPPNVILPPGYESWRSIFVTITGLPPFTTPLHIRDNFFKYGNISYIEIDEDRINGPRKAMLRFEPPPKDIALFQGEYMLSINGGNYRARVWYKESFPNDDKFTTPLGKPCPSSVAIKPTKVTFGVLVEPSKVIAMESVSSEGPEFPLTLTINFKKRKIFLAFPVRFVNDSISEYRVDIKFDAIKDIHQVDPETGRPAIIFTLLDTPPIWRRKANARKTFIEGRMRWDQNELWQRAVHIGPDPKAQDSLPVSLDDHCQVVDLGRWTTYCVELDKSVMPVWSEVETNLHDWNIKTKADPALAVAAQEKRAQVWTMLSDDISAKAGSVGEELALVEEGGLHTSLRFDVRYQLEVCISNGIINEYNIGQDFIEKLIELSKPDRLDPHRGRLVLEYAADQGKRIWRPMDLFSDTAAMTYFPTTMIIPEYCALMRKVIVTPTRIYFKTPTVETTNRVIRQFRHVKDNFIRLQFTDELMEGRVNGCEESRYDEIYSRAHRVLKQGILMGAWHWKFLAFGNSQIRENGAFFLCESQTDGGGARVTCAEVRKWMGSFDHIKTVGKYAARMGQCFSTTRLVPGIMAPTIVKIPDVERNGYCFTDGVGKMSPLLSEMIAKDWDLEEVPSAVQFRMGGCKGVLVTWPNIKGTEVHVRKSQEKFEAVFNGLEVIKCSQFSVATLNRQTITILESLGVPDHVFTEMMAVQVSGYNQAMTDRELAIKLLEQSVDENQTTLTIAKMVLNGFMETREPFVQTQLQLWRSWSIKSLKEKARLTVNQGAFVLGCVDETGTLKGHSKRLEGQTDIDIRNLPQIFLTAPKAPETDDPRNYKVITGLCVVGRNPSLHPGDIRVVNAVDVPALHHLKPGLVAFPNNGDRDIPSMCSGGDLDGDDFFVIWDQNLIPREWCYPPMEYKAPPPHQEKGNIAMDELMAVFFVLYMKNNNLPLIAHGHLATADREVEGAKHPKCIKLAELHSTAVDYVKTAVQAEWSKELEPRRWPHFMEKPKSYASKKVLGQLYDMVKAEKFELKDNYNLPFDIRILKKFDLSDDLLTKARKLKTKYDVSMRRIMAQLEIASEHEVWTTFVLSRPRVGTAYKLQEKVGRESAALKQLFRELCIQEAGGSREYNVLAPFVAAMYRVTWEEIQIAQLEARQPYIAADGTVKQRRINDWSRPLISFPWLFDTTLGNIATGGDPTLRVHIKPNQKGKNKQPKTKTEGQGQGHCSILEEQTEDLLMRITRTDDGHVIHRGEILHLFQHDENEGREEGLNLDTPEQTHTPESERGKAETQWDLDPELTRRSNSEVESQSGNEAESVREVSVSTPVMEATTLSGIDEHRALIDLNTPSPKKMVTRDVAVAKSVLAAEAKKVEPDANLPPISISSPGRIPNPPQSEEAPSEDELGGFNSDSFTDVEPECGYEEVVVIGSEEESALEKLARVLGE